MLLTKVNNVAVPVAFIGKLRFVAVICSDLTDCLAARESKPRKTIPVHKQRPVKDLRESCFETHLFPRFNRRSKAAADGVFRDGAGDDKLE